MLCLHFLIVHVPVAREGRAIFRCLAALEGSHLEVADSRLEPEGSLEGRWHRDKGEVDPPSLHRRSLHSLARAALLSPHPGPIA